MGMWLGELTVGDLSTRNSLSALIVAATGVGERDVPAVVVSTGNYGHSGSGGH